MSVDIHFGQLVTSEVFNDDGETTRPGWYVQWEPRPTEDDGTDKEYSYTAGQPRRAMTYGQFNDWCGGVAHIKALADAVAVGEYSEDMTHIAPLSEVWRIIEAFPVKGRPVDLDRATWLKYWCKRARKTFGGKAAILFTY